MTSATTTSTKGSRPYNAPVLITAVAALVLSIIYLCNWGAALSSPYSIAFESPMLWAARVLNSGGNIYALSGLQQEPWSITIYPPLYLALGAALVKLFGLQYCPLRI